MLAFKMGILKLAPMGAGGEGELAPHRPPIPPALLAHCRELRKNATDAEALLWRLLRNSQVADAKFRRQHPAAGYILDFYCHEARLAIEVDGGGHLDEKQAAYDATRTAALEAAGIRVLRFWNHEVLQQTEAVLKCIWDAVQFPSPPASPP